MPRAPRGIGAWIGTPDMSFWVHPSQTTTSAAFPHHVRFRVLVP